MSLLSDGSEFVQKDGTLFTVSLRTLAEASSTGGLHLQVTWSQRAQGASSKEQEEPCLAGRAGLPRSVNSETREVWASTSPLCRTPWGGHGIKRVTQGLHSFGGKAERRSLPSALHQLGLIREAVTGVCGGISGDTLPLLRPWTRGGSSVLQGRRGAPDTLWNRTSALPHSRPWDHRQPRADRVSWVLRHTEDQVPDQILPGVPLQLLGEYVLTQLTAFWGSAGRAPSPAPGPWWRFSSVSGKAFLMGLGGDGVREWGCGGQYKRTPGYCGAPSGLRCCCSRAGVVPGAQTHQVGSAATGSSACPSGRSLAHSWVPQARALA